MKSTYSCTIELALLHDIEYDINVTYHSAILVIAIAGYLGYLYQGVQGKLQVSW
jgi:hypothetical protein